MHPHFTRDMRKHLVAVIKFDAEHRVWQRFYDGAFHFYGIFFGHTPQPLKKIDQHKKKKYI